MFCRERSQTHVWSWKIGDASLIARASQVALAVMNLYASARDIRHMRLIPESGRSPGGGNGTPVVLPGQSHGQRSLAGYSPWGFKESELK